MTADRPYSRLRAVFFARSTLPLAVENNRSNRFTLGLPAWSDGGWIRVVVVRNRGVKPRKGATTGISGVGS
jgi:hypothetical protein